MPDLLVVDNDSQARDLAVRILQGRYAIGVAAHAGAVRELLEEHRFDLLLCDMHLQGESGIELIEELLPRFPDMAIVMVTGKDNPVLAERAFELGADGYLVKPYRHGDLLITVAGSLRRRELEIVARTYQLGLERSLTAKISEAKRMQMLLDRSEESLERSRLETVHRLSHAVELRDQGTGEHIERMARYCDLLAQRLDLGVNTCDRIGPAASMHDIGKIAVPDRILLKPGPLTDDERSEMERHTTLGREILTGSEAPLLQLAETIAWTHHERFDGSGYPCGLTGDEIPVEGRVAAVADVFDALTRDRPYRRAFPVDEAIGIMRAGREKHFDPEILDIFLEPVPVLDDA